MKTPRRTPSNEKAEAARLTRLRRQHVARIRSALPSAKRWDRFWIVALAVGALTLGPAWALDKAMRLWWRPDDPAVLMWWLEPSPYVHLMVGGGCLLALGLGLMAAARDGRVPRWPFLLFALAWLPAIPLAGQVHTFVYADRVVMSGRVGLAPRTLLLSQASSIETGCAYMPRSRGETSITTIDYVIGFGSGDAVDLGQGVRGRSTTAVGDWMGVVDRLDRRLSARGVPRLILTDADGEPRTRPLCLRALMAEQDEIRFRAARRILAIGDDDLYRYGLDPHGLW
jgi:hypothetical protein